MRRRDLELGRGVPAGVVCCEQWRLCPCLLPALRACTLSGMRGMMIPACTLRCPAALLQTSGFVESWKAPNNNTFHVVAVLEVRLCRCEGAHGSRRLIPSAKSVALWNPCIGCALACALSISLLPLAGRYSPRHSRARTQREQHCHPLGCPALPPPRLGTMRPLSSHPRCGS